MEMTGMRP